MKNRILYIVLAIVFLSLPLVSLAADKKKPAKKKTLRVLYWNIQNGMWAGQPDNYNEFVEWVKSKKPDICVFCEASTIYYDGTNKQMPQEERYLPEHWEELAARFGHNYVFRSAQRDNYPQVVTSVYPLDSVAIFVGEAPDRIIAHGSGWTRVNVEGVSQPINIVTAHLWPFRYSYKVRKGDKAVRDASAAAYGGNYYRVEELKYIFEHTIATAADPDKEYWIMAGDMNSYSKKDNFKYKYNNASLGFLEQDFVASSSPYYDLVAESYPGIFCPSHGAHRIDYFYVTKPLLKACKDVYTEPDSYTTQRDANVGKFVWPSDHLPIIADFNLSKLK